MAHDFWARVVVSRVANLLVTLLASSVAIFGALHLAPGDPAAAVAGGVRPDPENLALIRAEYHLDEPFVDQYLHWLHGVLTGDLGRSIVYRTDVAALVGDRLLSTLLLVLYAGVLIAVVGVGLGCLAALRGPRVRTAVAVTTTIAMGAPTFVVAIVLISVFSTTLAWLPIYGSGEGLGGRLAHLTLPAVSLAVAYVAYVATVTRTAVDEEKAAEHVGTARSRGLAPRLVVTRHVLRNAAAPVLTVSGLSVAGLFAGTAVAELAFGVNGIGSLLVDAAAKKDLAVVQVVSLVMVVAFVLINTLVDLVNHRLDPRVPAVGAAS